MSCAAIVRAPRTVLQRVTACGTLVGAAVLSVLSVAACRAPNTPRTTRAPVRALDAPSNAALVPVAREASLARRRASGKVIVRLSVPASPTLELSDALGQRLSARRIGRKIKLGDRPPRASLELESEAGGTLSIGAVAYRGALRISLEDSGEWRAENVLELEDYVLGVVARELGFGDRPREAWRAQAIAARSYALANLEQRGATRRDPYLFDGVRDQAYAGEPQPANARERASLERLREAVQSTAGLVLLEGGEYVDARYHSSCGGRTADGRAVFPELRAKCLKSVACEPCSTSASVKWTWTARRDELNALARQQGVGEELVCLAALERDESQRWLALELVGDQSRKRLRFEELRRALGRDRLRSALVLGVWPKPGEPLSTGLAFRGAGFGHGAGLCQHGALEYARGGWSAERILAHYFSGAHIEDRR